MSLRRTLPKILSVLLIVVAIFGMVQPKTAEAYDAVQRQKDIDYVTRHIGTANPDDLGTTIEAAKARYVEYRGKYNIVAAALEKIKKSNASAADKSAMQSVFDNAKKDMDGALAAYNNILNFKQTADAMLNDLKNGAFKITECTTSNGISGNKQDKYGEAMSYCGQEFNDDLRYPAYNENRDNVQGRSARFDSYVTQAKEILARSQQTITDEEIANAQQKAQKEVPQAALEQCWTWSGGPNIGICIQMIAGWFVYAISIIIAAFLRIAGMLLDYSISETVINVRANLDKISAIGSIWVTFRDIANLSFIFLLLYVAVNTILGTGGVNWKKTIVQIVIAAILINFSLFIAKAVIDVSNVVTLGFYNQLDTQVVVDGAQKTVSIAEKFMDMLGLQKIWGGSTDVVRTWSQSWSSLATYGLGTIAVLFITTFSFITAAWLFLYRYVVIIILLIVSPLAFASQAFPKMNKYWSQWWNALIGQALFPVIYMLFMWATILIGNQLFGTSGGQSLAEAFTLTSTNEKSSLTLLMNFVIVIVLLNAALALAKKQADTAGKYGTKFIEFGNRRIDSLRRTSIGIAQRNLVNRPLRAARKGYGVGVSRIATSKFVKAADKYTDVGTAANALAAKSKTSTGLKKLGLGAAAMATRVVGTPTAGLAKYATKAALVGVDRSINENLKVGENFKAQGTENLAEYEKYIKGRDRDLKDTKQEYEDKKNIEKALDVDLQKLDDTNRDLIKELQKTTARISTKELEEIGYDDLLKNGALLATLDPNKFKSVLDSKELNLDDEQKKALKDKRKASLASWAKGGEGSSTLSDDQRKKIADIQEKIRKGEKDADGKDYKVPNYGTFEEAVAKMKPSDIAELPADVLTEMINKDLITVQDLEQISSKAGTSKADRDALRKTFNTRYATEYSKGQIEIAAKLAYEMALTEYMTRNGLDIKDPAHLKEAKQKIKPNQVRITKEVLEKAGYTGDLESKAAQFERVRRVDEYMRSVKGLRF
jgi:hypothetical protein